MFKTSISKDELKEYPIQYFEGHITVIDKLEQVDSAVNYLQKQEILGFDTETRPSFKKGVVYKVALLQLSSNDKAFLFRINKIGLPDQVADLLSNKSIKKVGAAIRDDIKALRTINKFIPESFLELQNYIKDFGIESFSLTKMSAIVLGFRISKSQQLSNWENNKLSNAQKRYAATDAWVGYKIYEKLGYLSKFGQQNSCQASTLDTKNR